MLLRVTAAVSSSARHQLGNNRLPRGSIERRADSEHEAESEQVASVVMPRMLSTPSTPAASIIQTCEKISSLRRSTISASAPPGSARKKIGKLEAVCTSDTASGDLESEVIIHAAPTFCIQVPRLEASAAIHSARNTCRLSGAHPDFGVPGATPASCRGVGRAPLNATKPPIGYWHSSFESGRALLREKSRSTSSLSSRRAYPAIWAVANRAGAIGALARQPPDEDKYRVRSAPTPLTTSEKIAIALLMTWTAGFVDLIGFISLYGLYVSHMSGNTVAMARHISRHEWIGFVRRGWPIITFIFGLILGSFIYDAEKRRNVPIRFRATIGLETLLIGIFIAAGAGNGFKADIPPQPAFKFFVMVATLTIAMGLQNVSIRKVGGMNVYTTFVTGSLVKFAESISEYLFWFRDRTRGRFQNRILKVLRVSPRQLPVQHAALTFALWIVYLIGGISGGLATIRWELLGMLAPLVVLIAITAYGVFRPLLVEIEHEW